MADALDSQQSIDSMLHDLWLARREALVADVATLIDRVGAILDAPGVADDGALDEAAGRAHDLTGIFGALQQPDPAQVFRAACDDLRALRHGAADIDLDATLVSLIHTWEGFTT